MSSCTKIVLVEQSNMLGFSCMLYKDLALDIEPRGKVTPCIIHNLFCIFDVKCIINRAPSFRPKY